MSGAPRAGRLGATAALTLALAAPLARAATPIEFGLAGGVIHSTLTGDAGGDLGGGVVSFALGGTMTAALSPAWSVQLEVLYTIKGAEYEMPDSLAFTGLENNRLLVGYLEVPLLLRWAWPSEGFAYPYVVGGGYCAFRLDAAYAEPALFPPVDPAHVRDLDAGWVAGVGAYLNGGHIMVELRATRGLTPLLDSTDGRSGSFFVLSLAGRFPL